MTGLTLAAGLALICAGPTVGRVGPTLALLSLSCVGVYSAMPIFWTVPPALLSGSAAAAGIAVINAVGNLGGFCGPLLVGAIVEATGSPLDGLLVPGVVVTLGGVLVGFIADRG